MDDYFTPQAAREELKRLQDKKASLLRHCTVAIEADTDLSDEEKAEAIANLSDGLDNAFFRLINSIEDDLWWHEASLSAKRQQADLADLRARQ